MKKTLSYCLLIFFSSVFFGCIQNGGHLPPLNESYRKTDKLPFGSFIAYKEFQSEFPHNWINNVDIPFNKTWEDIHQNPVKTYSLYFLITKNLVLSVEQTNAMIEYVKAGNDLFISADYIDNKLLDAFYCSTNRKGEISNEVNGEMNDTHVSMFYGHDFQSTKYGYYYFPFLNYFNSYDTTMTRVLGNSENNLPNYIVLFSSKGRLYLHLAPRIFSNYFLLTDDNFKYLRYVISYLRSEPQYIFWDEYYKNFSSTKNKKNINPEEDFSTLKVINQNFSLRFAFYIAILGILLFVLFNVKRKQRVIETIKPNSNDTVAFTETIGRLYLQQKNNQNIAAKMITYFYEYLRNKYFIKTTLINNEFTNTLSGKSGVSIIETNKLFELIKQIQAKESVSDEELLRLNSKIENFKNQKANGRKFV